MDTAKNPPIFGILPSRHIFNLNFATVSNTENPHTPSAFDRTRYQHHGLEGCHVFDVSWRNRAPLVFPKTFRDDQHEIFSSAFGTIFKATRRVSEQAMCPPHIYGIILAIYFDILEI